MSDFVLAEGFGNLSDGTHTAGSTKEILGEQWTSFTNNFAIEDRADGRKWIKNDGTERRVGLTGGVGSLSTVAFCFRVIRPSDTKHTFASFIDSGGVGCFCVGFSAAGALQVAPGTDLYFGTPVATGGVIPTGTETEVEVRVGIHGSTGTVDFYINGVLDSSHTGKNTKGASNGAAATLTLWGNFNTANLYNGWKFSDIIVHTRTSPIGDVGVYYLEADADGTDTDFTPSAGANVDCVDEIGPDEDTTYNESDGTAGHRDSFTNAGVSGLTILSVGALVRARKTDTGIATLLLGAIDGASEDQSSAKGLSEDYSTIIEFFDDAPAGGSWDSTKVTAAEISYEVGA